MTTERDFAKAPDSNGAPSSESARGRVKATERDFARAPGSADALVTDAALGKPATDPPVAPNGASGETPEAATVPEDPTDSKEFDPSRFAATTLPPGFRGQLLAAALPVVRSEDLQDTRPPNRAVEGAVSGTPETVASPSPRAATSPRKLGWAGYAIGVAILAFVLALSALRRGVRSAPTTSVAASPSSVGRASPPLSPPEGVGTAARHDGLPGAAEPAAPTPAAAPEPALPATPTPDGLRANEGKPAPQEEGHRRHHSARTHQPSGNVFDSPLVPATPSTP